MTIIVGLGNPGIKFKNTRHNVGFLAIEEFAKKNNFGEFTCLPAGRNYKKNFNAEISEGIFDNEKIILAKPQTFMNDSGKSIRKLVSSFKFQVSSLIVIHDDIDLPISKIKIVKDRGSAGHKGVESIIKEIGSSDFIRFRIGIDSPRSHVLVHENTRAKDVVLKKFSKEEKEIITATIKKTAEALNYFLQNGLEKTMNKYNI